MKNPNNLLNDLAERARQQGEFYASQKRNPGKPGEFFEKLTEEEKETLRQLKSSDHNVRLDA